MPGIKSVPNLSGHKVYDQCHSAALYAKCYTVFQYLYLFVFVFIPINVNLLMGLLPRFAPAASILFVF